MRSRKDIESDVVEKLNMGVVAHDAQILEVLLDIRELLATPVIQKDFGKMRDALTNK